MSTVYIVQQPVPNARAWVPDLKPALQYGKIKYVFDGGEPVASKPDNSLKKAKDKLKDFDPETDFLLDPSCVDTLSLPICVMALMENGVDSITFLQWNKSKKNNPRDNDMNKMGAYIPITVNTGYVEVGNY